MLPSSTYRATNASWETCLPESDRRPSSASSSLLMRAGRRSQAITGTPSLRWALSMASWCSAGSTGRPGGLATCWLADPHESWPEQACGKRPQLPYLPSTVPAWPNCVSALDGVLARVPAPATTGRVRLWVDRSFTITGSGTVVTGTLAAGTLDQGDRLQLLGHDGSRAVVVRGLQSRDTSLLLAGAGQPGGVEPTGRFRHGHPPGRRAADPGCVAHDRRRRYSAHDRRGLYGCARTAHGARWHRVRACPFTAIRRGSRPARP